ncbi:hypothetical protein B4140_0759 [Bacillus amyloliquefaciens]|nr:hypothetical protein B4140_0759 [Bacillus amyloliquefaciens]
MIHDAIPIIREFTQEQVASYFEVPLSAVVDYKFAQPGNTLNSVFNFCNNQLKAFG